MSEIDIESVRVRVYENASVQVREFDLETVRVLESASVTERDGVRVRESVRE